MLKTRPDCDLLLPAACLPYDLVLLAHVRGGHWSALGSR